MSGKTDQHQSGIHYEIWNTSLQTINKRINDLNYENFEDFEKSALERQKHRLTTSYHPLYTFLLSKFSLDSDIFISQK